MPSSPEPAPTMRAGDHRPIEGAEDRNEAGGTQHSAAMLWARRVLKFIVAQWLILGFGFACVMAWLFPWVGAHGGTIRSEYTVLYGIIAFIFLVSGLQLSPDKLKEHATNWRLHIVVQGVSFLLIPAIVLAVLHICIAAGALTSHTPSIPVIIGTLVTACIPTTIASNVVMTRLAGGDDGAAIISVVVGNLVGSFLSPLLIYAFFPTQAVFDDWRPAEPATLGAMYASVAKQMGLAVVLPLLVGQAVRWWRGDEVVRVVMRLRLHKANAACLIIVVWTTFCGAFQSGALYTMSTSSIVFNVFMNLIFYMLFTACCFYIARPPLSLVNFLNSILVEARPMKKLPRPVTRFFTSKQMPKEQMVAVCFCGAAKTTGLGIPLVAAMWSASDSMTRSYIQIPVLLYTIEQIVAAQLLVYFFKWYMARDRKAEDEDGINEAHVENHELSQHQNRDQEEQVKHPYARGGGPSEDQVVEPGDSGTQDVEASKDKEKGG